MDKITHPRNNLTDNLRAASDATSGANPTDPVTLGALWRSSMEFQARFISNYADGVLVQLVRNRLLMAEHLKQVSAHTRHVASLMAHAAVRAVAIAAHARRESRDRRVFPLPFPNERRFEAPLGRRKLMSGNGYSAAS